MNNQEEIEINLLELLFAIRKRLWIIVLSMVTLGMMAGLFSYFMITPIYTSKATLYVLSKTSTTTSTLQDFQIGQQLTKDYMVLIKSRQLVNQVIDNMGLDYKFENLVDNVTVTNPTGTSILQITVNHPDPFMAKKIADEFAHVSEKQIKEMLASDAITKVLDGEIAEYPSSPNVQKNALIAALFAAFVSTAFVVVIYMLDDTVKSEEDIEKHIGISTLGMIPVESGTVKQAVVDKRKRRKQFSRQMKEMR